MPEINRKLTFEKSEILGYLNEMYRGPTVDCASSS